MNPALQKTLVFLLLIAAGYFLQKKINGKQDLKGIKVLILSVVLPATIFVALLKIKISAELLLLPVGALALNFILFYAAKKALPQLGFTTGTSDFRTMVMLIPSLAPGLSCFPFVMEYLGDEPLAMAALADVGNKVFVLIILYLIAMNWYYGQRATTEAFSGNPDRKEKLKDLGLSLLREPVNLVIVAAILMLSFGLNISSLPGFLETTAVRLAALMTPIVLLFIGMAVRFERREMTLILRVLAFRSGIAFFVSGIALLLLPAMAPAMVLLLVIFPQSAVSFWPFAHMSAVEGMRGEKDKPVFNVDLALNVLACSLPFATVIILTVLSCGEFFTSALTILPLGAALLVVPAIFVMRNGISSAPNVDLEKQPANGSPAMEIEKKVAVS
ncbi:AEC family transporter [Neolewinella agarilytica]|uniref:AEC family transporter n=1 Tax=Neolewinella agarilytica TaxID=478744 RepID=UPI0023570535|nr:permease [Neolewinella agarilytica]